jgi:hypothetical protein
MSKDQFNQLAKSLKDGPPAELANIAAPRLMPASRKMVPGLAHLYPGLDLGAFFAMVDESGGWPVGYGFVGFRHSDEREAGFCNSALNDGWWTVVASADDYYLWKLSPRALQRVVDAVVKGVCLTAPTVKSLKIRGEFHSIAPLSNQS